MTSHYNDEGVLTSTPSDLILTSIGPPRADRIKAEAARAGMSPHMWIEYALDEILANLHSDAYIDGLYPHIQAPLHPTSGHGPLSDPHPGTAPKPPYDRIPPGGITHTPPTVAKAPDPDCPCQWPIDGPDGAHIMGCPAGVWVDPEDDADADD